MTLEASKRHKRLAQILRSTSGPIRAVDVVEALGIERTHASKMLADWHNQGVVRRVARGLYVPVSPQNLGQSQVLPDPWVLVPELYSPGYVGGWSALEHWELTEQLFRSVCVFTSKRTTYGANEHQGVGFYLKHVAEDKIFGTKTLWRENTKLAISDVPRTLLDVIDTPYLGAGLQHVMDCLTEFRRHGSDDELWKMIDYADRLGNGAIFKKLGYLAEILGFDTSFVSACTERLSAGYAHIDKDATKEKLVTRWRLWVPEDLKR